MVLDTKLLELCIAIGVLSFFSGCKSTHRSSYPVARICSPNSDAIVYVESSSRYTNLLLHVDEENKTLRFLTAKGGHDDGYLIRTYGFDGILIEEKIFPQFNNKWRDYGYGTADGGAFSPDIASVAYLGVKKVKDPVDFDLYYLNVETGIQRVLVEHIAKKTNHVFAFWWVSNKDLLLGLQDDYGNCRLLLIDVRTPTIRLDLNCKNINSNQFAVSHSKRFLAYWEGHKKYASRGSFKILDLHEMKEVARTKSGDPATFGGPKWSQKDDALAFIMDDKLMRFSLATKQTENLKSFEKKSDTYSSLYGEVLMGSQGGKLYYRMADAKDEIVRLQCFDLASKQDIQLKNHPEGMFQAFVCNDGTIIYYKSGQDPLP